MAPAGQGQVWSDVLCCVTCSQVFSSQRHPVNLSCGHVVCRPCLQSMDPNICPIDETGGRIHVSKYPPNTALLHIVSGGRGGSNIKFHGLDVPTEQFLQVINKSLKQLASHLCRAESERGGSVYSEVLSRTMQRKLVSLLCFQLVEEEGRSRALKTCRAVADRVMTEVLLSQQVPSHLSTQLWTAVRSRGCQFLGPAMQEDVLRLILLALGTGAPIARKTLVMYVVQMLSDDYPQVSKTCVGHVVQLLYRASCFHVLKREGESSLMQLKEEFRSYEHLRREHDMQIVQMALEAGLRICPDQWSSLLYGDQHHRSHMQSIIDKLSSHQSYQQGMEELSALAGKGDEVVQSMMPLLHSFATIHPTHHGSFQDKLNKKNSERVSLERFTDHIKNLSTLVDLLVHHNSRKHERRYRDQKDSNWRSRNGSGVNSPQAYKTKMCRDVMNGQLCPRGSRCTWAHSPDEIHESRGRPVQQMPQQQAQPQLLQRQQSYVPMQTMPPRPTAIPVQVAMPMVPQAFSPARRLSIQQNGLIQEMMPVAVHPGQPMPLQPMLLMSAGQPANSVLMGPPQSQVRPVASPMWQPQPMIIQQAPQPSPTHQTFWISQNPPPMPIYPLENSSINVWGRESLKLDTDPDQLFLKRKEIISRLAPFTVMDDDDCENDGGVGHVSYTVASSVLDERGEIQFSYRAANPPLELPPIPGNYAPVMPPGPQEESIMIMGDIIQSRPRASSLPLIQVQVTTVLTPCPGGLISSEATKPATVQSDCSEMQVTNSVNQSLPTAIIQGTPVTVMPVVPIEGGGQMIVGVQPVVLPIVGSVDPQDVVSNTIDRIVDVKERLNEANSATLSCVVSEQLREELRIAEREMDSLDPRTQASCLLRELEQVDREIERMELSRPVEG